MKFAHIADCHIGAWRDEKLKELNLRTFREAINICIKENVAFVLIAGDLFNTALPSIDSLKDTASILDKLRENDISVYIIPGSHDYSPSGKTMLDVLERAGLVENVVKLEGEERLKLNFTVDKTNTKITGLFGKKGGLEKGYYELLDKTNLESADGFKIFMFHTMLEEFKPEDMNQVEGQLVASLPKNFDYYAGGHVHYIFETKKENYGTIVFPGALFPNNFAELEEFKQGGFYIVNVDQERKLDLKYVPIKFYDVVSFDINVDGKTSEESEAEILKQIKQDVKNKIVTLRISGVLESGKVSDINFKEVLERLSEAYTVLKNTNKLTTKEYEEIKVAGGNIDEIEENIVKKNLGKVKIENYDEEKITKELIDVFNLEKNEGEKIADFEKRLMNELLKILNLEGVFNDN